MTPEDEVIAAARELWQYALCNAPDIPPAWGDAAMRRVFNAVRILDAPPPEPQRPEPKFKVGDRVVCGCGNGHCGELDVLVGRYWSVGDSTWRYISEREVHYVERNLRPAPWHPIPIGGWFDPGDGTAHQRIEPHPGTGPWADEYVFRHDTIAGFVFCHQDDCKPLSEREALERRCAQAVQNTIIVHRCGAWWPHGEASESPCPACGES